MIQKENIHDLYSTVFVDCHLISRLIITSFSAAILSNNAHFFTQTLPLKLRYTLHTEIFYFHMK